MNTNVRSKPASQDEITLFSMMGQALLNIQVMEECLSISTTLKVDIGYSSKVSKVEADELLKKRQALTLGRAINVAKEKNLYEDSLQIALEVFLDERNWLVHKSITDFYTPTARSALFRRLKAIALEAHRLQQKIEDDTLVFKNLRKKTHE